jgi:hypothetical protein
VGYITHILPSGEAIGWTQKDQRGRDKCPLSSGHQVIEEDYRWLPTEDYVHGDLEENADAPESPVQLTFACADDMPGNPRPFDAGQLNSVYQR